MELSMDLHTWVLAAVMLAAGGSAALLVWLVAGSATSLPPEDRQYLDPPPPMFRIVWWPIRWVAQALRPLLRERQLEAIGKRLGLAGWEYGLTPAQFVAARGVYAALLAAVAVWMTSTLAPTLWSGTVGLAVVLGAAGFGAWLPGVWLGDRIAARRADTLRGLPFCLDIITLCVEAGLNLQGAIAQAVAKGPKGVIRDELQRCLRDIRAGKARAEALKGLSDRLAEPAVTQFVSAVLQAEAMGMNLGPVLRAQADQRRAERFLRAEKLAMQAPVKMLLPLIGFIFPCTFIVLFFPIAMKFIHSGL
jgi:tight adherence protein C